MPKNLPHPNEPKPRRTPAARPAASAGEPPATLADAAESLKRDGLAGLANLKSALKADAAKRELERVAAARAQREAIADADVFRRSIGEVEPLKTPPRQTVTRIPPPPVPLQTRRDEEAVLQEALSDEYDPESLLDIDETLSYCRTGVSQEVVRKLRRGAWIVQAQLDLHGMRRDEAREALAEFIRESVKRGLRCLRVIHGKGLGSIGREPVLKGKVRAWLVQKQEVIAFCQARPHDGGAGAVLVLLQPGGAPRHRGHPLDPHETVSRKDPRSAS
ncbi:MULTISPECIES: Smr/MutS family protein [unclassified Caballeronia]|uniref:Smr/MutS family protein n=1 Tax=unclassified Caballeronia TaxID=2646786 RepID=UPI00285751ED|nr:MULTISPECIES: Smr/MutS family protein [unclassified Caballeronia]MDR5749851.1 Smr/MutS family protein [Caballeronia sp. LZ024]MDR5843021.1 Smr/MutS family protein [Caballeronia sp. LZ031]